jgi:endonuclease/exonuclease/phosphatase family metal-dependent hydrolase
MKNIRLYLITIFFLTFLSPIFALNLKTATFNIRMATSADGINEWKYRVPLVEKTLQSENIDVIGFQEVLHTQLLDLQKILPDYAFYGVGREDFKEKGEYAAIFYKKDQFQLIEGNTFVLAADTNAVGVLGWDAACTRIVTWVLLEDLKTKERFYFFNTHFDHIGKIAQKNSADLLVQKAVQKATYYPVIITGDFNSTPTSEAYMTMTKSFTDSKTISPNIKGDSYTYQGFKKVPIEQYCLIDYIFVTSSIKIKLYKTVCPEENGVLLSDHNLVVVEMEF